PKSGKVEGGQSTQISFIINSTNLSHRTYNANLVVECNDPTNPSLTLPVTINAQDTKGPDFNMVFFQNPYLSQYLRVMVFAHETLNEIPQLTVDSDSITMVLHDTSYHIYMGKHQLSESGDFTFSVTGNDSLGNIGSFERILSVSNIQLGKPAMVSNISGNVAVKFPVNSFDEEVFVTIWEERNTESSEEPFGRIYHLGPEQMPLNE
ncbi:MAG: hypothetical protein GWN00_21925, partial [Aliifodinibius sp.]|nr:hypothetical protein [Fodinibius sp.]NIV13615.1 hypothetical protein [Fodinibius sp.]NIY27362.1 hypothetical protein [Fodinibius sp.]